MSASNITKSRKRYSSNVIWMTALYNFLKSLIPAQINTERTAWYNRLVGTCDEDISKKYLKITWNRELIPFWRTFYSGGVFSEDRLKGQVKFELKSLPMEIRSNAGIDINEPEWQELFGIMYMTRKYVAIAEGICVDKRMPKYMSDADMRRYNAIWQNCIRIRSSTFSTIAPAWALPGMTVADIKEKEIIEYYETWGEKAGAPFYGNRRKRIDKPETMHRDDPYLGSWAGAHRVPVDTSKSVLGLIERIFNLPERCDISGTTTDALGFALFQVDTDGATNPDLFAFLNIFAMILTGHHSLFETGTAASLWSTACYAPFEPLSLLEVLGNLKNAMGVDVNDRYLKQKYDGVANDNGTPLAGGMKTWINIVEVAAPQENPAATAAREARDALRTAYQYTKNLWQDLSGSMLAGADSKLGTGEELKITQPVYILAEKLADKTQQ